MLTLVSDGDDQSPHIDTPNQIRFASAATPSMLQILVCREIRSARRYDLQFERTDEGRDFAGATVRSQDRRRAYSVQTSVPLKGMVVDPVGAPPVVMVFAPLIADAGRVAA